MARVLMTRRAPLRRCAELLRAAVRLWHARLCNIRRARQRRTAAAAHAQRAHGERASQCKPFAIRSYSTRVLRGTLCYSGLVGSALRRGLRCAEFSADSARLQCIDSKPL